MYWQKRGDGYTFIYYDQTLRKNIRLRSSEIPSGIKSDDEADQFCRLKESEHESIKLRIKRKLDWQAKFYDFNELLQIYKNDRILAAPNSWGNDCFYLSHYVFPFFLQEKGANNINNWPIHFEEFKDYLLNQKLLKRKTTSTHIAFATKNHCIKALNTFLETMFRRNKCSELKKCKMFSKSLLNKKSLTNVVPDSDSRAIHAALQGQSELAADLYLVLLNTGLRLNEAMGLSLGDLLSGEPTDKIMQKILGRNEIICFGHLVLESQPSLVSIRNKNGEVPRKPLKKKKKIEPRNNRTIPISDKAAYNVLVKLWKRQKAMYERRTYGDDKKNYLLFDGLNKNIFSNLLRTATRLSNKPYRSAHDCRHTFCTHFAGKVGGDIFLCELVLGHRDSETTRDYMHLQEQINKEAKTQLQVERDLDFVS